jgi:hypothetical protein
MSKPNVHQKTILNLLSDAKADFLIPDYQRPYAWNQDQCQTLWDDLVNFTIPGGNHEKFDSKKDEYFLGSIVAFQENEKHEIIDGQQRLTTFMLILRAFHKDFENRQDNNGINIRQNIEKCIWKYDEFENPLKDELKITSEVAGDDDKDEFLSILKNGNAPKEYKSQYAENFRFFENKIQEMRNYNSANNQYIVTRLLKNCAVLFVEAETQDSALRIFSTLNDRGLPLADADIFKSKFYKLYSDKNQKNDFIEDWKKLEAVTDEIFHPSQGTPMDELFTKYMYFLRAKNGTTGSTTESLRNFFRGEKQDFPYFKNEKAMDDLSDLAIFWKKIYSQNESFGDEILRKLFILRYSPNTMWENIVSVWFLQNRDSNDEIDLGAFSHFLSKITNFILGYSLINPGVNQLRTPIFKEMSEIVKNTNFTPTFENHLLDENSLRTTFDNFDFNNMKNITKSFLVWFAFSNENQQLLSLKEPLQIEHIFAKKRAEINGISDKNLIESIGNKIILESSINIKASDFEFDVKKDFYLGKKRRGSSKEPSKIAEIIELTNLDKFDENEIIERKSQIIDNFIKKLKSENLLK